MITSTTIDGLCHVRIRGDMTIYNAAECRALLLQCLQSCREAELDLSEVNDIDSAGIQLLIQAKREGAAFGKPVRLVAHSPVVQEIIDLFQLAGDFGDPIVIARRD